MIPNFVFETDPRVLARQKLEKAATRIILEHPFFASLLMNLERAEDPGCGTMWTDGIHLGYEPEFVNEIAPGDLRTAPMDKLLGVIAHEIYHVVSLHHLRLTEVEDHDLANDACDYAINPLVKEDKFVLPDGHLDDQRFHNKSAEEIYATLLKERRKGGGQNGKNNAQASGQQQQKGGQQPPPSQSQQPPAKNKQQSGQGGGQGQQPKPKPNFGQGKVPDSARCGAVKPMPSPSGQSKPTPEEKRHAEQQQIMRNMQALNAAKQQGKAPGYAERMIKEQATPVVAWQDVIARFVDETMNANDYSWSRPNRRYASSGFYLPALRSPELGTLCLALDTSASISEDELRQMVSECLDCLEAYVDQGQEPQLPVIYCDSRIQRVEVLSPGDKPKPKGGGGTDFAPVMGEVRQNADEWNSKALVYMTDGYCGSFGSDPGIPVLWILNGRSFNKNFKPPFGEVAIMKGSKTI